MRPIPSHTRLLWNPETGDYRPSLPPVSGETGTPDPEARRLLTETGRFLDVIAPEPPYPGHVAPPDHNDN